MREFTYIILTFLILISCSKDKTLTTDNKAIHVEVNHIQSLKENIIPILNGVWVLTDYINEIERTKSPLKSSDKLRGLVTMIIDGTTTSDSIVVGASLNNHEGYNFTTYFKTGQKPNSLKTNITDYEKETNFYELGYEMVNNQVLLVLYNYNKANKLINKKMFSKVANKQADDDAAWGLQYIVNEKLFSGNYYLIDSNKPSIKIQFKSDGTLTGLNDFKTFSISTDFVASGPDEDPSDAICFNPAKNDKPCYQFKIKGDTIILKQGHLQYNLVRQ